MRRALRNGKIDLLQAEAIQEIVDARKSPISKVALGQLDGGLSRRLLALRSEIIQSEVLLAYDIDFPEADDGPIAPALEAVMGSLEGLLATAPRASLIRNGSLVVIAGPPNAGKSSLSNALLGEARALVTGIPGATRDVIEALLDVTGMPLRLVDTAGLRATDDVVEQLGIKVSEKYLGQAQIVLACAGDVHGLVTTIERVWPLTGAPVVAVLTKANQRANLLGDIAVANAAGVAAVVSRLSADDATGAALGDDASVSVLLTRERQRVAIAHALEEVCEFERAWLEDEVPATIAAVHLRTAVYVLEDLVGSVGVEDVLDVRFREFCVGK